MSHRRECIPFSPSSSDHDSLSSGSSSSRGGVTKVVPTATSEVVVSSIKPFLLGFVAAVMLIAIVALSSITTLCKGYKPITDLPQVVRETPTATPSFEVATIASAPTSSNGGIIESDNRRLKWREKIPIWSKHARKRRAKRAQRTKKLGSNGSPEEAGTVPFTSTPQDSRGCLCRLVWEFLGYRIGIGIGIGDEPKSTCSSTEEHEIEQQPGQDRQLQAIEKFPTGFTPEITHLTPQQETLIKQMRTDVLESVSEFEQRTSLVPWGGPPQANAAVSFDWYGQKTKHRGPSSPLDQIDGGNLFSSYLRIMKWPENLGRTEFPFKLCKSRIKNGEKPCDATVALRHSLEFRERYMPWLVTPGIKSANSRGLSYYRGFSPQHPDNEDSAHAIVWLRLEKKNKSENENERIYFVRSILREFDRAVAASLQRSNGRVGKFNVVVDGKGFTWSQMPSLGSVKTIVAILQDHFADRLGVIVMVNVGSMCEILLKLFLPLITEEVRNKIAVLPQDPKELAEALQNVLGETNIPTWLGGADDYEFDPNEYYANDFIGRDEEALEYLTTMPFHA
mmetsp:Transcript_12238/g.24481  ORF Transcript_12238/g.24481 Transcript_12238/m.24481 type:complete len:564 (-) Transcript_12238:2383-4074(-)